MDLFLTFVASRYQEQVALCWRQRDWAYHSTLSPQVNLQEVRFEYLENKQEKSVSLCPKLASMGMLSLTGGEVVRRKGFYEKNKAGNIYENLTNGYALEPVQGAQAKPGNKTSNIHFWQVGYNINYK